MFLSGAIYTATGGYDAGFYYAGSIVFVSGIVLSTLPCMKQEGTKFGSHTADKMMGAASSFHSVLAWQIGLPPVIEKGNSVSEVTKL